MTTKRVGALKITGLLALTMEATVAVEVGDDVEVNGDWTVGLAAGTKPVLGRVSVANKKRVGSDYPVNAVPGDVTVEAKGLFTQVCTASAAITAGWYVKAAGSKKVVGVDPATATVADLIAVVGIALTSAAGNNSKLDVLYI